MGLEIFLSVLVISAAATSMTIEVYKQILNKFNKEYKTMPTAVIIAFIVGIAEMVIYTYLHSVFTPWTILYAICMGIANVLGATTSYDTVKALILTYLGKINE